MKKILLFIPLILSASIAFAQNPGWHELGSGANALNANDSILCVASDYNGNVYCAGAFTNSLGKHYVAKWDGNAWSEVGGLNGLAANGNINCIAIGNYNIRVAGSFTNSNGKYYVAEWNGTSWSELGTGANALNANGPIRCLSEGGDFAGGDFKNSSGYCYVALWNGSQWSEVGTGVNALNANGRILAIWDDCVFGINCIGQFKNANGDLIYSHNLGQGWSTIASFQGDVVYDFIITDPSYSYSVLMPVNNFNSINQVYTSNNVYNVPFTQINQPLFGSNLSNGTIRTIGRNSKNGAEMIAAGAFKNSNLHPYVAKFTGWYLNGTWSELGASSMNPLNANNEILCTEIDTLWGGSCNYVHYYAAGKFTNANGKYYVAEYIEPVIWGTSGTPLSTVSASADTICHGTLVNFMCNTTNAGNSPVYNWYKNNLSVGSNSASISLSNLNNQDSVWCDVNPNTLCVSANSVISNKIQLTDYQIPVFQTQPTNVSANTGSTSYFKATANNAMHYQWQVNNGTGFQNLMNAGSYNGTTTDSLIITNVNLGLSNNYYRCIASNGICNDTSSDAILNVVQVNGENGLNANSFSIYPNPATNELNIQTMALQFPSEYKIYNDLGQVLLKGEVKSSTTIVNIASLPAGKYLIIVGEKHSSFVKSK